MSRPNIKESSIFFFFVFSFSEGSGQNIVIVIKEVNSSLHGIA
jgi:hypothetical protein